MSALLHSARARLREVGGAVASIFFPAPCRSCGELLDSGSRIPFCTACLAAIQPITGPQCERCGKPILSTVAAQTTQVLLCHMCRRELYDFDFARSFARYDGPLIHAITALKYDEVRPLGVWFAQRLADLVRANQESFAADAVVPVPLHATRLRERGYNQAELIAKPLARLLGIPFRSYLLVRTKPRPDKLILTRRERWRIVHGAYATRAGAQVDKLRVLLLDDVMTTGATLDACSRALRGAGATRVVGLTVARVLPNWEPPGESQQQPGPEAK